MACVENSSSLLVIFLIKQIERFVKQPDIAIARKVPQSNIQKIDTYLLDKVVYEQLQIVVDKILLLMKNIKVSKK